MFRNWGFLIGEIWVTLLLAALLGLLAGWIIWGRRSTVVNNAPDQSAMIADKDRRIAALEQDIKAKGSTINTLQSDLDDCRNSKVAVPTGVPTRPEALSGPRNGQADDLKKIKGVGLQLEKLCNSLGFYHFDQIAAWTSDEVAWVDQNLQGFTGRVTRDDWIAQAKLLAAGGETAFSKKVDKGDVY